MLDVDEGKEAKRLPVVFKNASVAGFAIGPGSWKSGIASGPNLEFL